MSYTDPSTLTWETEEYPTSAKMNSATNDQFLALLPDGVESNNWAAVLKGSGSDPTTSDVDAVEYQFGPLAVCFARFVLSAAGSGQYRVDLPSTAAGVTADTGEGKGQMVGGFTYRDDSTGQVVTGAVNLRTTSQVWFVLSDAITINGIITHNNPFAAAAGDVLSMWAMYPVA